MDSREWDGILAVLKKDHSHSREGAYFFVIMCIFSAYFVHMIHVYQAFHNVYKIFAAEM